MQPLDEEQLQLWESTRKRYTDKIKTIIAHSNYLINLATDREDLRLKSLISLQEELERAAKLKIPYYVLHTGSHKGQGNKKGIQLITTHLDSVLKDAEESFPFILLETSSGGRNSMGNTIEELAEIISSCRHNSHLGICIDTCHLFVSGYKLYNRNEYENLIEKIERLIGIDKLLCIHTNDSTYGLGSCRDRHEHIGKGKLGIKPFWYIMQDVRLKDIPKIIETPKSLPDGREADTINLSILKRLAQRPLPS